MHCILNHTIAIIALCMLSLLLTIGGSTNSKLNEGYNVNRHIALGFVFLLEVNCWKIQSVIRYKCNLCLELRLDNTTAFTVSDMRQICGILADNLQGIT